jgi:branched-subunit amino acid aminotransferase/4-amino-4-deoxychorismate lyase
MHEFVSFNCNIVSAQDASVSALSFAALYGKGIFTTVAIYDGRQFLWEKHWRRLENNAEKLNVDIAIFPNRKTREILDEIIDKNGVSNGRARITFFDESASTIWLLETVRRTSLLITTGETRPVAKPFKLTVSPYRVNSRSPLVGVKSCNYLDKLLALDEAKSRGFNEAIQLNERGDVTSVCMANVFWLKDSVLYTPSPKTGCLAGTTREFVLENLDCCEVEAPLDELNKADAIYLTSAGLGVTRVARFESRQIEKIDQAILSLMSAKRQKTRTPANPNS